LDEKTPPLISVTVSTVWKIIKKRLKSRQNVLRAIKVDSVTNWLRKLKKRGAL